MAETSAVNQVIVDRLADDFYRAGLMDAYCMVVKGAALEQEAWDIAAAIKNEMEGK